MKSEEWRAAGPAERDRVFRSIQARDLMTTVVATVNPETTLEELLEISRGGVPGYAVVLDPDREVLGVIALSDLHALACTARKP